MDLYIWENDRNEIIRFQLCYTLRDEHALTWDAEFGYTHDRVDGGETRPGEFRAPILMPNGSVSKPVLLALLHGSRFGLEPRVYEFVAKLIQGYDTENSIDTI